MVFLASLALLAGIAAGSLLLGRALVGALGERLLLRLTPLAAVASALLGTAAAVVVYGWLTECGLRAARILSVLVALLAALLVVAWARGRLQALRPRGTVAGWAALFGPLLLSAILCLLPLVRGDWNGGNDTFTYCAVSERLQDSGFAAPFAAGDDTPVTGVLRFYHGARMRLAAAYLLAIVQAASPGSISLLDYPAAATWVFLLQMGAVALCLRSVLRLPTFPLAGALLAFAVLPHPGQFAHHDGFFAQPCGIAALLLGMTILARLPRRGRDRTASGILLALVAAFLLSVYSPLAPVLAAAVAWQAVQAWWQRRGRGHDGAPAHARAPVRFVAVTTAAFLAFAFLDLRAFPGTLATVGSMQVGGHIAQSLSDWLAFGLGTSPGGGSTAGPWRLLVPLATAAACGLALLGAVRFGRQSRTRVVLVVCVLLATALGYYALFVTDPWSGQRGHTWNVFKLVQWSYPLVFVLQCGGLRSLPERWRMPSTTLALLLAIALAPQQAVWLRPDRTTSLAQVTRTRRPLDQLTALRQGLRTLPPGELVLLGRAPGRRIWLLEYLALLAYPRPIVREKDARSLECLCSPVPCAPAPILFVCRSPTTPLDPVPDLGWGCGPLSTTQPSVVELDGRSRAERDAGAVRVVLFSPREMAGELVIDLPPRRRPWPAVSLRDERRVLAEIAAGPVPRWRFPLKLQAGLNRLELRAADRAAAPLAGLAANFTPRAAP